MNFRKKAPEERLSITAIIEAMQRSLPPAQGGVGAPLDPAVVESFTNSILVTAIERGASDFSLEPQAAKVAVRIRVNGVLSQMMAFPKFVQEFVLTRVKVMADIPTQEDRTSKQGWIPILHAGKDYSLRVSTLPTQYGEVLQLQVRDLTVPTDLQLLGFSAEATAILDRISQKKSGLLLLAGPPESGLTTTAAALLQRMGPLTRRICTQETRREYTLAGAIHIYAAHNIGDSMAGYVSRLLAHDPDVILLGNICDRETAQAAIDAALSGVLTVATIPAIDTVDAVRRLLGFGIDHTLVARALSGVCAQRLVPCICPYCAAANPRAASELNAFGYRAENPEQTVTLRRGVGCSACGNQGTRGRTGLFEVLVFDEAIARLLATGASDDQLRDASRSNGSIGMREDALSKILAGSITLDDANAVWQIQEREGRRIMEKTGQAKPYDASENDSVIARMANAILVTGIDKGASDIGIRRGEHETEILLWVDGVMSPLMKIPLHVHAPLIARYKTMAALSVEQYHIPQCGHIPIKHQEPLYNVRVNTLQALYGENATLHVLERHIRDLPELGFDAERRDALQHIAGLPNGLLLIAGPQGMGRTSTVAALLQTMDTEKRCLGSLEEVQEYRLSGVLQIYRKRTDAADGIRALLAHRPDVLFLGEIDSAESAQAVVDVALSNVLTIATIPTLDAADAVRRLITLGVERSLVARAVAGVCAQRLVRRICPACAVADVRTARELLVFGYRADDPRQSVTLRRGVGCAECGGTGFRGRIGVFEVLTWDDTLAALLANDATADELREASRETNRIGMREDALGKILAGRIALDDANEALHRVV